jgi:hypothetical protein
MGCSDLSLSPDTTMPRNKPTYHPTKDHTFREQAIRQQAQVLSTSELATLYYAFDARIRSLTHNRHLKAELKWNRHIINQELQRRIREARLNQSTNEVTP